MKHTPESLSTKTLPELDEIMALAQGWKRYEDDKDLWFTLVKTEDYYEPLIVHDKYSPTTNKEQAWDLMVKYKIDSTAYCDGVWEFSAGLLEEIQHKDPLVAVTIASILAAQGE